MTVIDVPKVLKMLTLFTMICGLAHTARVMNPNTVTQASPFVTLIFNDKSTTTETLECLQAFAVLKGLFFYFERRQQPPAGSAESSDGVIFPCINNSEDYARFKSLWAEAALLKQKKEKAGEDRPSIGFFKRILACFKACWWGEKDLTADEFIRFFATAEYLILEGEGLHRFAVNMVKRGLLGKRSAKITSNPASAHITPGGEELARLMLLEFAEQVKLEVKVNGEELVFVSPNARNTAWQGMDMSNLKKVRGAEEIAAVRKAVLIGCMKKRGGNDPVNLAAAFGWLLCHAGIFSVSVGLGAQPDEANVRRGRLSPRIIKLFKQSLAAITQLHGEMQVMMERLDLTSKVLDFQAVKAVMKRCPHLEGVIMYLQEQLEENDLEGLGAFPGLETVCIRGLYQKALLTNWLAAKLPNLKNLEICLEEYTNSRAVDFSGCSNLVELVFSGGVQNSLFVMNLLKNLPKIKYLSIRVGRLDDAVAVSFARCPELVVVRLFWGNQTSLFVMNLLENLPELNHLSISAISLDDAVAASFANCSKLVKVKLFWGEQTSSFVQLLLENLPEINELSIRADKLDDAVAASFAECTKLKVLVIDGEYYSCQSSSFVIALAKNIPPTVTHLKVRWVDVLNGEVGAPLSQRKELQELELGGRLEPGFFAAILQAPLLGSLKRLVVRKCFGSQEGSPEDDQAISAARNEGIQVYISKVSL